MKILGLDMSTKTGWAILEEKDGSRFTDEDQQQLFAGDTGFEFVYSMGNAKMVWGGITVGGVSSGGKDGTITPVREEE